MRCICKDGWGGFWKSKTTLLMVFMVSKFISMIEILIDLS